MCIGKESFFSCCGLRSTPVLRGSSTLVEWFCGTQWLMLARYKGPKWLGAYCRRPAQPPYEMQCSSVYILLAIDKVPEKETVSTKIHCVGGA